MGCMRLHATMLQGGVACTWIDPESFCLYTTTLLLLKLMAAWTA